MLTESQPTSFASIDWGSKSHQACILASDGTALGERAFPHSGEGLAKSNRPVEITPVNGFAFAFWKRVIHLVYLPWQGYHSIGDQIHEIE